MTTTPAAPEYMTVFQERITFAEKIGWNPEEVKSFSVYPAHILVTDMHDVQWILKTHNMKTEGWTEL